jgi:signal transduction histidine kinase
VCAVSTREQRVPQAFRILLRTPADVEVVQPAPWWTSRRAAWVLSVMGGIVALALAWVATLRRQVQAQAGIIWKRVRRETELQERQRMARELHDTLEQNLAGISLCLEAAHLTIAATPAMAEKHVARALAQVEASIDEVHRAVWALREESLETRGLAACLDEIGRQLSACRPGAIELATSVEGAPRPFAVAVENNLLRIGQEALTNAVRHGQASRIVVRLRYDTDAFSLSVRDDGRGFDATAAVPPGHFGLAGMRERVQVIGGRLDVRSAVNRGTEVTVTLPLEPLALRQTG